MARYRVKTNGVALLSLILCVVLAYQCDLWAATSFAVLVCVNFSIRRTSDDIQAQQEQRS